MPQCDMMPKSWSKCPMERGQHMTTCWTRVTTLMHQSWRSRHSSDLPLLVHGLFVKPGAVALVNTTAPTGFTCLYYSDVTSLPHSVWLHSRVAKHKLPAVWRNTPHNFLFHLFHWKHRGQLSRHSQLPSAKWPRRKLLLGHFSHSLLPPARLVGGHCLH